MNQALSDEEKASRKEFANWILNDCDEIDRIVWRDESTSSLDDRINRHNFVIWSTYNPQINISKSLHSPWMMVWIGFAAHFITSPFFFESTVTAQSY